MLLYFVIIVHIYPFDQDLLAENITDQSFDVLIFSSLPARLIPGKSCSQKGDSEMLNHQQKYCSVMFWLRLSHKEAKRKWVLGNVYLDKVASPLFSIARLIDHLKWLSDQYSSSRNKHAISWNNKSLASKFSKTWINHTMVINKAWNLYLKIPLCAENNHPNRS